MAPGLLEFNSVLSWRSSESLIDSHNTNDRSNGIKGTNGFHGIKEKDAQRPQKFAHENLKFDPKLKPKEYRISGTKPESRTLFRDVKILDSTGSNPYHGDVLTQGERISHVGWVPDADHLVADPSVRVIEGRGRTLMSGLGDAHTHMTWNNGSLDLLGGVGVEEHTLSTARAAQCYLDCGYTMCFGAASAKDRLDIVIRDAINAGHIPGPRYLANGREMAVRDGELAVGITVFADGPMEMREVIRHHVALGVDQIKLSMSGEEIVGSRAATDCYFSDEETAACVDEAHRHGIRLCSHARARDSVIQCVRHGVDVIYHASYTDEQGLKMLEEAKHKHVVAPAINWLYSTSYEATAYGFAPGSPGQIAYEHELKTACTVLKEMHKRGVTVLPGGDYGFNWTPHGTYARDLEHFVKLLDFTPMESIVAATAGVAKLFMQETELGLIRPGFYADCILVDGDPLKDISILQDIEKLNVIMINGRIHKASREDFARTALPSQTIVPRIENLTNFIAYRDALGRSRVGSLDVNNSMIVPLAMSSGASYKNLYEVIELSNGTSCTAGDAFPLASVKMLPPISGRDILCVGRNYAAHGNESAASAYDFPKTTDSDLHPSIVTKRHTSIIAADEEICPHQESTSTLDYGGEVAVIIGKAGFRIDEKDAMDHVWGYTIVNNIGARKKPQDHRQSFVGKSADTFCPMGPIAVPKQSLPSILRVQTHVNGAKRQDGTTADLIFSIPKLIKFLSAAMTLQLGDVIATGTPAGVGFDQSTPKFLALGDRVEVTVTGLGTLSSVVASAPTRDVLPARSPKTSSVNASNMENTYEGVGLVKLGEKLVSMKTIGSGSEDIVFVHGLGARMEYYDALIQTLGLQSRYRCHLYDLEGHGLSPTRNSSICTLASYVADLENLFRYKDIKSAAIVGWSLGCLVSTTFAIKNPSLVQKLVLLGPGPSPFPQTASEMFSKRAAAVRAGGMQESGVADAVAEAATSAVTKATRPVALSAVRLSLLSTHPEGYAKGCMALAASTDAVVELEKLTMPTLILTADEDKISPPALAYKMQARMEHARVEVIKGVGHWHVYEDVAEVARVVGGFL